jgi:hypothetical protein
MVVTAQRNEKNGCDSSAHLAEGLEERVDVARLVLRREHGEARRQQRVQRAAEVALRTDSDSLLGLLHNPPPHLPHNKRRQGAQPAQGPHLIVAVLADDPGRRGEDRGDRRVVELPEGHRGQ